MIWLARALLAIAASTASPPAPPPRRTPPRVPLPRGLEEIEALDSGKVGRVLAEDARAAALERVLGI